jgi:hypothetical protein
LDKDQIIGIALIADPLAVIRPSSALYISIQKLANIAPRIRFKSQIL